MENAVYAHHDDPEVEKVIREIKSQGHFRIQIHPLEYRPKRLPIKRSEVLAQVSELAIRSRGWDYPHVSRELDDIDEGENYLGCRTRFGHHIEYWRIFESAQFVHLTSFWENDPEVARQMTQQSLGPKVDGMKWVNLLYLVGTVTEVFRFASRMALKDLLGKDASIEITLNGTKDRYLGTGTITRPLSTKYLCKRPSIAFRSNLESSQLIGQGDELSIQAVVEILDSFESTITPETLRGIQTQVMSY